MRCIAECTEFLWRQMKPEDRCRLGFARAWLGEPTCLTSRGEAECMPMSVSLSCCQFSKGGVPASQIDLQLHRPLYRT